MKYLVAVLFILAVVRSFYHLPHSSFDADEEYFAKSGKSILSGNLTLIGQETGVGALYHAPLFNYLIAFFLWIFHGNPLVVKGLGAAFAAITVPAFFLIGRKLTSTTAAFFSSLLVLFSDSFLGLESFAPNITPLTLLVLFFLLAAAHNCKSKFKSMILGALVGLSAHFHIVGMMLIPSLVIINWRWLPVFLLFVSPLIFFDFRHNHLITNNALSFFANPGIGTPLIFRLNTYFLSLADHINLGVSAGIFIPVAILALIWGLFTPRITRMIKIVLLLPLFFFLLYSKHLVPYYAIVSWTPFILIFGVALEMIWEKRSIGKMVVLAYLGLFIYGNTISLFRWTAVRGINNKIAALEYIKKESGSRPIYISRTMERATNFGFDYLMDYVALVSTGNPNDPTYTLVVPADWQGIKPDKQFGDIGIVLPHEGK
ncbi:glycosyltransferase family 39 protein [Candidatus Collierbacteria bacterium]|nr:glycosyltransferase family 39 protein [Candidatus Collierbacteria bacterium]